MTLWRRLGLVGVASILGVGWMALGRADSAATPAEASPAAADRVEVRHELVRVGVVEEAAVAVQPATQSATHRSQAAPPPAARPAPAAQRSGPGAARTATASRRPAAVRILIGDGRYKPEPFPGIKTPKEQ